MKTNNKFKYIDVRYLIEMSDNNLEFMNEVISVFKTQVNNFSFEFNESLDKTDYVRLKSLFHKAQSAMSVMGIHEIVEKLKKIEALDISFYNYYELKDFINRFGDVSNEAIKELDIFIKEY